jgi:tetratricopeptide (TPR) repeat protein
VKLYLYSLAHVGRKKEADALFAQYFRYQDHNMANHYGEYLIEKKKYTRAEEYYDSLVHSTEEYLSRAIYYNWALIPFIRGEIDTALSRFDFSFRSKKVDREFYRAAFKIATIHYLKNQFDTAAYYYGIASEHDSLRYDALDNRLVCFKKSGDWDKVIESGTSMLSDASEDEKPDIRFNIGYAYLRSGAARNAIEHLKFAAGAESSPEFYYWLAEAYLTTGELAKALYQYRKIAQLFPKDDMWTPTALYKTGIVLEFMNEIDEAERIYKKIIRERGVGDTWGIEAQKRLKEMK